MPLTNLSGVIMTLEEKIVAILEENKTPYEIYEHEPVYTNPAMAEALSVTEVPSSE